MSKLQLTEEDAEVILHALIRMRTDFEAELAAQRCSPPSVRARVEDVLTRVKRLCRELEDKHVRSV